MTVCPTRRESLAGLGYVLFQYSLLPPALFFCNGLLPSPLGDSQLNLIFFALNFGVAILIFRRFLVSSLPAFTGQLKRSLKFIFLGFFLCTAGQGLVSLGIRALLPDFLNQNDLALQNMAGSDFWITALGTVILVPPAEECIHRGMIFRGLYEKSPWAAYLVSAFVFSLIHVLGYLGIYSPGALAAAFLQYLLPGLILAWSYQKTDTIFVPILIHALINLKGMLLFLVR